MLSIWRKWDHECVPSFLCQFWALPSTFPWRFRGPCYSAGRKLSHDPEAFCCCDSWSGLVCCSSRTVWGQIEGLCWTLPPLFWPIPPKSSPSGVLMAPPCRKISRILNRKYRVVVWQSNIDQQLLTFSSRIITELWEKSQKSARKSNQTQRTTLFFVFFFGKKSVQSGKLLHSMHRLNSNDYISFVL